MLDKRAEVNLVKGREHVTVILHRLHMVHVYTLMFAAGWFGTLCTHVMFVSVVWAGTGAGRQLEAAFWLSLGLCTWSLCT